MARRPVFELVCSTLQTGLFQTECSAKLIEYSNQGWHYKMPLYPAMLEQRGAQQSISRKNNCFDNTVIERFFGTLKAKYHHLKKIEATHVLEAGVHGDVRFYNHQRIKLGVKGSARWSSSYPGRFKTNNQFARNLIPNLILTNRTKRINNRAGRLYTSQKICAPRDC
jgi:transposase InsO family protein